MSFVRNLVGGGGPGNGNSNNSAEATATSKMESKIVDGTEATSSSAKPNTAAAKSSAASVKHQKHNDSQETVNVPQDKAKKSVAELDEELRMKMSGMAGDGGEAGVEYEDGKPVAMKRSVKENMFRYI
ncbi:hypothetical protein MN608_08862 [Microdochium nivale]|nr:hypothetical protein MN608_08862 [Microdochium nivale]